MVQHNIFLVKFFALRTTPGDVSVYQFRINLALGQKFFNETIWQAGIARNIYKEVANEKKLKNERGVGEAAY